MVDSVQAGDIIRYEVTYGYALLLVLKRLPEEYLPLYEVLVLDSNRWDIGYGKWALDLAVLSDSKRLA